MTDDLIALPNAQPGETISRTLGGLCRCRLFALGPGERISPETYPVRCFVAPLEGSCLVELENRFHDLRPGMIWEGAAGTLWGLQSPDGCRCIVMTEERGGSWN